MAETLSIILMLAAVCALIAFLDFVLRNIDDALDEALGKEKAATEISRGDGAGVATAFDAHETGPSSHDGQGTFNR